MTTIKSVEILLKDSLEYIKQEIMEKAGIEFAKMQAEYKSVNGRCAEVDGVQYELQNWYGTLHITDKSIRANDIKELLNLKIDEMCAEIGTRLKNAMFTIDPNAMCIHELCDWMWLSNDDGSILKQVDGRPVYAATLVKYAVVAPRRAK